MRVEKEQINLSIAKSVMDDLRRAVPARERAHFIEAALARELRRLKLRNAIKNAYGAWKDEDHPELTTFEDVNRWVEEGRKRFTRDFSNEWGKQE
jgi:hypothetical protein